MNRRSGMGLYCLVIILFALIGIKTRHELGGGGGYMKLYQ